MNELLARSVAHWSEHQVAEVPLDVTAEQSLAMMNERNAVYPGLLELMPTDKPGLRVLDFGCGPGHDMVGFLLNGAEYVYAYDVSPKALKMTHARAHGARLRELLTIMEIAELGCRTWTTSTRPASSTTYPTPSATLR